MPSCLVPRLYFCTCIDNCSIIYYLVLCNLFIYVIYLILVSKLQMIVISLEIFNEILKSLTNLILRTKNVSVLI